MAYVVGKCLAIYGIKGYHLLLTGAKKIPADDAEETQEREISALKVTQIYSI